MGELGANSTIEWTHHTFHWLGTSVGMESTEQRLPSLCEHWDRARFLFVSAEPLLGPVHLKPWLHKNGVRWVIGGGESAGPKERALLFPSDEMSPHRFYQDANGHAVRPEAMVWARQLRDDCIETNTAFFWKQWGGPSPRSGGRVLDGREWNEFPE